jgi:hypothetical protein
MADEDSEKLDLIIRLLAANVGPALSVAERAPMLRRLGLDLATIAVVCNTTTNSVSVRLAEARRRNGKRGGAKRKVSKR